MGGRDLFVGIGIAGVGLAACGGGAEGPVTLRFAERLDPTGYAASYEQDVDWGEARIERRYAARYTLGADDASHGAARLDALRAALSTPHGRQTLDARHLAGAEFELGIAPTGGRPGYSDDAPVLEMPGMLEGEVALSRLLDFGFPNLPAGPVSAGDRWSGSSTAPEVQAHVFTTATATTEYTFAGWETVDGIECARIEGRTRADVAAEPHERYGSTMSFAGTLEGELVWHFDPEAGALVRMTGEISSSGVLDVAGAETPIRQVTRVRIDPAGAS